MRNTKARNHKRTPRDYTLIEYNYGFEDLSGLLVDKHGPHPTVATLFKALPKAVAVWVKHEGQREPTRVPRRY